MRLGAGQEPEEAEPRRQPGGLPRSLGAWDATAGPEGAEGAGSEHGVEVDGVSPVTRKTTFFIQTMGVNSVNLLHFRSV